MSDTSLVFNLIGRDRISGVLGAIKGSFKSTGAAAESSMDKATKSVKKMERELDQAERKLEQLDESAARAAFAQEAAQTKLGAAQAKYNSLVEKGSALQAERVAATERVSAAEQKVAASAEKSAADQKAALGELEAAKKRLADLDAKEGGLTDRKVQALARVRAAEIAVADAVDRSSRADSKRSKVVADIDRLTDALRRANDEGGRSTLGSLFDAFRQGYQVFDTVTSAIGSFSSAVGSVISPIYAVASALAIVSAAAAALAPALSLAGGALGAFAAAGVGLLAGVGTLKLGLFGLGDEYTRLTKATGGGGGGGGGATKAAKDFTAATRAVEQAVEGLSRAERDVTTAQADALAAQKAVNAAREQAADRLRDQALDLKDAQLSQADAADAVTEAQGQLNIAMASGDPIQIKKAQRAYDEAVVSAERAKNRVDDLTQANKENTKTGVEGSDEVVQAKKREQDARQRVADSIQAEHDAEMRLADARKSLADQKAQKTPGGGGGGGAGQAITKLAPAARDFLNVILGLRPAMERLRLDVQQHLFAGLADKLQHLAAVWQGPATKTLTSWADTFNSIAKTVFDSVSKKSFIDNISSAAESARKGLAPLGKAVGPLIDAFGRLARAGGPFLEKIGTLLGRALEKFSGWIKKADESGKLTSFFKQASDTLGKVWDIGGKVFTIVGKIIGIVWGQSSQAGNSALDAISTGLTGISAWLDDPKNQKSVRDLFDGFLQFGRDMKKAGSFAASFAGAVGPAMSLAGKAIAAVSGTLFMLVDVFKGVRSAWRWLQTNTPKAWGVVKTAVTSAYNWVVAKGGAIINWVKALGGRIASASRGAFDGLKNAAKSAFNAVASLWNRSVGRLSFHAPGWVPGFGGMSWSVPTIPYLAKGGTITGRGMAVVGDRGPELLNLPAGAQVTPLAGGPGNGMATTVVFDFKNADSIMATAIIKLMRQDTAFRAEVKKLVA